MAAKSKYKKRESTSASGSEGENIRDSKKQYTFFWRSTSPFSQWHFSDFEADGYTYNCAEQYMMHKKALLFGDEEIAKAIMETSDPREQKGYGRQVKNFDPDVWNDKCREIVKKGNTAKFTQNEKLKVTLFATKGTVLVEASPNDSIWGIGLAADNPKAWRKATWKGTNWLGYCLTEIREELLALEGDHCGQAAAACEEQEKQEDAQERFTFFFGNKSPFSQHYPVTFTVGDLTYNCAEQYMMQQKASMFLDAEMEKDIMKTSDPKVQKSLGRKVRNFDPSRWGAQSRDIVKTANKAKFGQNPDLKEAMMQTKGTTLVEASPRDRLWGIGMGAKNPKALCRSQWRGKNWLGECLTQVREELVAEESGSQEGASHGDSKPKETTSDRESPVPQAAGGTD